MAMEDTLTAFEATLHQVENIVTTRNYLAEGNGAHPFLEDAIQSSASTLEKQYANGVKAHGLSSSNRLRLVKLHRSLQNVPEGKEAIRLILKDEIAKLSEQSLRERCDSREARLYQCLLNLWGCLQPETTKDHRAMEDAILEALFLEGATAVLEGTYNEDYASCVSLTNSMQRTQQPPSRGSFKRKESSVRATKESSTASRSSKTRTQYHGY